MKVSTIPMVAPAQKKAAVQRQDNVTHDHKAAPAKMNKQDLSNHKLNKLA